MTKKKPNHLVKENSPYLLQHAYNPVDWHPWDDEALTCARTENKLLVISIGYAACHWCHVMEHESFEDEEVAEAMNRHFISIKVDREERPDIDHIYMAAAYTTTGRGGWPLNVIALPDQRPLFAGTYYAKRDWLQILKYFADLQNDHPEELIQHALEIEKGMRKHQFLPPQAESGTMDKELLHDVFLTWQHDLDFVHGGTHGAPKFPMPANLDFLLEFGQLDQNRKVLDYVELSMDKMAMGGIYDHLGGGFSRYSVDASWHVPHFEKMLYDNAQLISLYSHGYSVTSKFAFKKVVEESVTFIERELTNPEGLFYASLDADSEGEEGLFYGWTYEEIIKNIGDAPAMFLDYYSVEETGNWENGLNILRKTGSDEEFAKTHGISVDHLSAYMDTCRSRLFTVRGSRIRPATDDKILTCWNALMISSLTDAARAFNKPVWLERAVAAATFYRVHLVARNGKLWRNAKGGVFAIPGFLDDYCFLIKSFLDLYQSTIDETWLTSAEFLMREVLLHFSADDGVFFNLSSDETPDLIQKTVELSDNVIPSSNSQMARNLFVLGNLLVNEDYLMRSETMLKRMLPQIRRNPAFHSNWAALLAGFVDGPAEVKIIGEKATVLLKELSGYYLPRVVFSGDHGQSAFVENNNSRNMGKTLIYVCRDKTCFPPVESAHDALQYLGIK